MGTVGQGAAPGPKPLPGIAHVIAVGSGKGGVGKTTLAVNLSVGAGEDGASGGG